MKKRFFRSLETLLDNKKLVLPFLGLLAASALLVWTTAFVPGKKENEEDLGATGETPYMGKTSSGAGTSSETRPSAEVKASGTETQGEHRQCKALTKKGTRCQHVADESGYCRQHRALFEQVPVETNPNL